MTYRTEDVKELKFEKNILLGLLLALSAFMLFYFFGGSAFFETKGAIKLDASQYCKFTIPSGGITLKTNNTAIPEVVIVCAPEAGK